MPTTAHISQLLTARIEAAEQTAIAIRDQQTQQENADIFFQWLQFYGLTQHRSFLRASFGALGWSVGAASTYSTLPLGIDFAALVTAGSTTTGAMIFRGISGAVSFLPTAILLGQVTQSEFESGANFLEKRPRLPFRLETHIPHRRAMVGAHFAASLSGIPFYALLQPYFITVPVLEIMIPMSAMVSSYCACISTERQLVTDYFLKRVADGAADQLLRKNLQYRLNHAAKCVKTNPIIAFQIQAYRERHVIQSSTATLALLRYLLELTDASLPAEFTTEATSLTPTQFALAFFAGLLGAASLIVFYPTALETMHELLVLLFITNALAQTVLETIFSVISLLANMSFDAMYAKADTDRMYAAWCEGQRYPSWQAAVAITTALVACFPIAYLALTEAENWVGALETIPSFIGGALARDLAFYNLLQTITQYCFEKAAERATRECLQFLVTAEKGISRVPSTLLSDIDAVLAPLEASPAARVEPDEITPTNLETPISAASAPLAVAPNSALFGKSAIAMDGISQPRPRCSYSWG